MNMDHDPTFLRVCSSPVSPFGGHSPAYSLPLGTDDTAAQQYDYNSMRLSSTFGGAGVCCGAAGNEA